MLLFISTEGFICYIIYDFHIKYYATMDDTISRTKKYYLLESYNLVMVEGN